MTYRRWECIDIGRLQIILFWRQFVPFSAYTWYGVGPVYDIPVFRELVILSICFRWWCRPSFTLVTPDDTQEADAVRKPEC